MIAQSLVMSIPYAEDTNMKHLIRCASLSKILRGISKVMVKMDMNAMF